MGEVSDIDGGGAIDDGRFCHLLTVSRVDDGTRGGAAPRNLQFGTDGCAKCQPLGSRSGLRTVDA